MRVLIVTGARDHPSRDFVEREVMARLGGVDQLWHGDARGVDRWAATEARLAGVAVRPFGIQGHETPTERNQRMVDTALAGGADRTNCVVLALPGPDSKGTWDMKRRCDAGGLRVEVRQYRDPRQGGLFG